MPDPPRRVVVAEEATGDAGRRAKCSGCEGCGGTRTAGTPHCSLLAPLQPRPADRRPVPWRARYPRRRTRTYSAAEHPEGIKLDSARGTGPGPTACLAPGGAGRLCLWGTAGGIPDPLHISLDRVGAGSCHSAGDAIPNGATLRAFLLRLWLVPWPPGIRPRRSRTITYRAFIALATSHRRSCPAGQKRFATKQQGPNQSRRVAELLLCCSCSGPQFAIEVFSATQLRALWTRNDTR